MQDIKRRDQTIETLQNNPVNSIQEIKNEPMDQDENPFLVSSDEIIPQQSPRITTTPTKLQTSSKTQSHTKKFDEFLDLRKKLRRAIFKSDSVKKKSDINIYLYLYN